MSGSEAPSVDATGGDEPRPASPERTSLDDRRRALADSPAEAELPPPRTRREMKARGILLTSEIPVVPGPGGAGNGVPDGAAPQPASGAASAAGADAHAPGARRRELRGSADHAGPATGEAPDEPTSTGRRPVVRVPAAARGVRTVDDTGEMSGVLPAVSRAPVAWAHTGDHPAVPPQPVVPPLKEWTTSPSSWESAVMMPAHELGIEDSPGPPASGSPMTPPNAAAPAATSNAGEESAAPPSASAAAAEGPVVAPGRAPAAEGAPSDAVAGPAAVAGSAAVAGPAAGAAPDARAAHPDSPTRHRSEAPHRAPHRGLASARVVKYVALVLACLAIGVLIYLISSGSLGAIFTQAPEEPAGGAAVVVLLAGWTRLTKERRDR